MAEYEIGYEYVDGGLILPPFAGRKMPRPPVWVRQRMKERVPDRARDACLSKEIADLYPAQVREVLVKYVVDWPLIRKSGADLLIAGPVTARRQRWAATAVMNEIVMRYGGNSAISVDWFGGGRHRFLLDARDKKMDEYMPIRNRILKVKLLMIENPLSVERESEGHWFLRAIYQHRYDNRLPTITTLPADLSEGWGAVKKVLGPDITDILRENHFQYLAHY
jgi:hypothetical protein